jgi:hypothetical protein
MAGFLAALRQSNFSNRRIIRAACARSKIWTLLLWAHFGLSLHVSQMTANWGRAAFQADEYILGIIANFVRKKLPFSVTWLACSSGFFP